MKDLPTIVWKFKMNLISLCDDGSCLSKCCVPVGGVPESSSVLGGGLGSPAMSMGKHS